MRKMVDPNPSPLYLCHHIYLMAHKRIHHHIAAFKAFGGLTQGDPLSLTILNVVVDAFVRH